MPNMCHSSTDGLQFLRSGMRVLPHAAPESSMGSNPMTARAVAEICAGSSPTDTGEKSNAHAEVNAAHFAVGRNSGESNSFIWKLSEK